LFYLGSWRFLSGIARRINPGKLRERFLGFFGPLSLRMCALPVIPGGLCRIELFR